MRTRRQFLSDAGTAGAALALAIALPAGAGNLSAEQKPPVLGKTLPAPFGMAPFGMSCLGGAQPTIKGQWVDLNGRV